MLNLLFAASLLFFQSSNVHASEPTSCADGSYECIQIFAFACGTSGVEGLEKKLQKHGTQKCNRKGFSSANLSFSNINEFGSNLCQNGVFTCEK